VPGTDSSVASVAGDPEAPPAQVNRTWKPCPDLHEFDVLYQEDPKELENKTAEDILKMKH
jgi:hypothetical protein